MPVLPLYSDVPPCSIPGGDACFSDQYNYE